MHLASCETALRLVHLLPCAVQVLVRGKRESHELPAIYLPGFGMHLVLRQQLLLKRVPAKAAMLCWSLPDKWRFLVSCSAQRSAYCRRTRPTARLLGSLVTMLALAVKTYSRRDLTGLTLHPAADTQ